MTLKRRKLFRRILWWWEECPIIKTKYSERTRWGNNKYLRAATTVSLCNNQIFFGKKRISSSKRIFTTSKLTKWSPSLFLCYKKVSFQAMHRIRLEYMISCWWYQAQCMFLNTAKWNTRLTCTSLLQTQSKTEQGIFGLWITLRVNRSTVCVCALSDFRLCTFYSFSNGISDTLCGGILYTPGVFPIRAREKPTRGRDF